MSERDDDLTWRVRGVCQSVDPEVFFPAPSEPADAAVALCRTCDVQGACLAWALQVGDCHGVWGATTPRERRAMLVAWHSDEVQDQLARERPAADPPSRPATSEELGEAAAVAASPARERGEAREPSRPVLLPVPRLPVRQRELATSA